MLAVGALVPESTVRIPEAEYSVMAGVTGDPPVLVAGFDRPSSQRFSVGGVHVEIRMDSWLASDTIRRMGFGHVIAARPHTLIIERGISFVAFGDDGRSLHTGYVANMFARQPRYLIDTRAWQP